MNISSYEKQSDYEKQSENSKAVAPPNLNNSGTLVLSTEFHVLKCDALANQILGLALSPSQECPLERIFTPADVLKMKSSISKAIIDKNQRKKIKRRITLPNGKHVVCEYTVTSLLHGTTQITGVVFSFEHKTAENAAHAPAAAEFSSIDYQALFETLPEGVFTVNKNWRITSFNRTAEIITGFHRSQVIGRHCWDIFQSDLCHKNCPLAITMKTGEKRFGEEIGILDNNGTNRAIRVNSSAICDKNGAILGAIETFHQAQPEKKVPLENKTKHTFKGIIGKSAAMQTLFAMLPDIAASDANVIILGESGTGKELMANALHNHSSRKKGPMVAVNCMEFAETLLESELFGHEKGAFTGAQQARPGRFEAAKGGTLFLDEIGELKPDLQVKLLRVLEQRRFERVGGNRTINLEARIISATNKDLNLAMRDGCFREDLYYRLRTVAITIPPLRQRLDDIPLLVDHFIRKFNARYNKSVRSVDPKVLRIFSAHSWPGNVRELERCMEHAFVFVKGPIIFSRYLPDFREFVSVQPPPPYHSPQPSAPPAHPDPDDRETILWALTRCHGKRKEAADLLGISRTSLWRRMKAMGI